MSDELSNPLVQEAFREAQRELGMAKEFGVLGNNAGQISAGRNRVWVRKVLSNGEYSRAYRAIAMTHETTPYVPYVGSPIILGYVFGELSVLGQNSRAMEQIGINPAVLNTGDPSVQGVATNNLLPLLCHAVGTQATPSTKVGIKSFRYYDAENQVGWYQGSVSTQVDLASYIPTAGNHRYVAIFFKTSDQTFSVTTSTSKSTAIPLSDIDKQECFNTMPPLSIPVAMWRLADAQTSVTQADFIEDLRPLYGVGTQRQNYSATTNPANTDDSDEGYGVGSVWINVTTDDVYICVDATPSSAVWVQLDASAGMTSWTLAGDSGTPQTIADGNTATVAGDNYVETTAGATDTVIVRYVASALHIMGW